MKKIFKKNQLIVTALAGLVAIAGYLNFSDIHLGSKQAESTAAESIVEDISSLDYDLTDETAVLEENQKVEDSITDTPGETVLTSASNFAAQAKIDREQVRAQSKASLQEIIDNPDITEEQKSDAVVSMIALTDIAEKEAAAELLLEAKGFKNAVVNLTGSTADVVLEEEVTDNALRAQIEDIMIRKAEVAGDQIVISTFSGEE